MKPDRVTCLSMSLLLRMEPKEQLLREQTNTSHFGLGSWAQGPSLSQSWQERQRERVKAAIFERKYKQIMDARLSHLPVRLPFPRTKIIKRLKENDRLAPNWDVQERLLEVETELAFLHKSLSSPPEQVKPDAAPPKTRRLSAIWDYLSLSSKRLEGVLSQRVGRLNFNVGLFFQSDLPSFYLIDVGESTQWELAALSIAANAEAERLVRRLCDRAADQVTIDDFTHAGASLRDIEKVYRDYVRRFRKVTTESDRVLEWRDALEYYVDLFSAGDLATFRSQRAISMASLDSNVLNYLSTGLHGAVQELRRTLVADYARELSGFSWLPSNDPSVTNLLLSELEAS